jgi:signal transduction histidine kinase
MQAPLSSTASGKHFRSGPLTALLPAPSRNDCTKQRSSDSVPTLIPQVSIAEGVGLAHDAGNLFGALGLYCDLLALPGVLREEHRHYAEELRLLSGRSRKLIDRLLNPHTTQIERTQEHVVVPEVMEQCRGLLDKVARRAVQVQYEPGTQMPVAVAREALERILVNLTKNAAEASDSEAPILLRVSCLRDNSKAMPTQEQVVLTVEDKGCGMSIAAIKGLMGETQTAPEGPRGIGFRVVQELVSASGGQLRLKSNPGYGTSVEIAWAVTTEREQGAFKKRRRLRLIGRNASLGRLSC